GLVEHLTVGDFDGDLVNDLAFSQVINGGMTPSGNVSVAFGVPLNLPRTVQVVSEIAGVEQLARAHSLEERPVGTINDLAVVANRGMTYSAFSLLGNAARAMTAPIQLTESDNPLLPVALAIGNFADEDLDIGVVAVDPPSGALTLWRIE